MFRILFLFCCLVVELCGDHWVDYHPSERFAPLTHANFSREDATSYFMARNVAEDEVEFYIRQDLYNFSQALTILFDLNANDVLSSYLGNYFYLVEGCEAEIDHVGRELYGPIPFYLSLLTEVIPQTGLLKTKEIVFPSTQVVKSLQEFDPDVKGVTIGRVYFKSISTGKTKCIELFQPSLQDGSFPQTIEGSNDRFSLLTARNCSSQQVPIDHLSVEVSDVEHIHRIHQLIHESTCETLQPCVQKIAFNPGDGSTFTKALIRDSTDQPFNKIVEFVHYKK